MNETRGTRYQRLKRRAHVVAALSGGAMLGVIALSPLARWMADAAAQPAVGLQPPADRLVSLAVFVGFVVVLWQIAALPALLYLGVRVDRRYGRSTNGTGSPVDRSATPVTAARGMAPSQASSRPGRESGSDNHNRRRESPGSSTVAHVRTPTG